MSARLQTVSDRQLGRLMETPGFAPSTHDEFAFIDYHLIGTVGPVPLRNSYLNLIVATHDSGRAPGRRSQIVR